MLTVLLLAIFAALCLQGLTEGVGQARTDSLVGTATVSGGGSVLYEGPHGLTSRGLPARTVALTFDDGPDSTWTPRVLAVLAREHVPATFFIVGTRAAQHPELVRRVLAQGSEVGAHTWSHADLSNSPGWRRNLELSLGQLGLEGSAGVSSALLRPPYSSGPDALTPADARVIASSARAGYVTVLADRDAQDWMRPGVPRIVQAASPSGTAGVIVLMHDAGGDRSQTVTALPLIIDRYRQAGFRFTTVSAALGLPTRAADSPVHGGRRLLGLALLLAVHLASLFTRAVTWIVLPLVVLVLIRTLGVALVIRPHQRISRARLEGPEFTEPVSVLVPAYNEAVGIEAAVRSLSDSDYPGGLEILVIDDGSSDGTADIVRALELARVRVISNPTQGKRPRSGPAPSSPATTSWSCSTATPSSNRRPSGISSRRWATRVSGPCREMSRSATARGCSGAGSTWSTSSASTSIVGFSTCCGASPASLAPSGPSAARPSRTPGG